jgi:hypothetical protein
VKTGVVVAVAGAVSFTHAVNGFCAPHTFCRSKTNPCPCSPFAPLWVWTFIRPPAACATLASTLPAVICTSRMAASLSANPRPPAHTRAIPAGSVSLPLDEPFPAPPERPNASSVGAPSTAIAAGCVPAPRSEVWPCPPDGVEAVGALSSTNSSQRRPLTGMACNCAAVIVVVTAAAAGPLLSEATRTGGLGGISSAFLARCEAAPSPLTGLETANDCRTGFRPSRARTDRVSSGSAGSAAKRTGVWVCGVSRGLNISQRPSRTIVCSASSGRAALRTGVSVDGIPRGCFQNPRPSRRSKP